MKMSLTPLDNIFNNNNNNDNREVHVGYADEVLKGTYIHGSRFNNTLFHIKYSQSVVKKPFQSDLFIMFHF